MKTLMICLMIFVIAVPSLLAEDRKPQKFDVTFKIRYQAKTLSEIAELERLILDRNRKACSVKIKEIEEAESGAFLTISDADTQGTWVIMDDEPEISINNLTKEVIIRNKGDYKIVER